VGGLAASEFENVGNEHKSETARVRDLCRVITVHYCEHLTTTHTPCWPSLLLIQNSKVLFFQRQVTCIIVFPTPLKCRVNQTPYQLKTP
jgi:hypothetical protein